MPKSESFVAMPVHVCLRCGHKWVGRQEQRPVACPNCHSVLWDKPRVRFPRHPQGKPF